MMPGNIESVGGTGSQQRSARLARGIRAWTQGAVVSAGALLVMTAIAMAQAPRAGAPAQATKPAAAQLAAAPAAAAAAQPATRPALKPIPDDPNVLTDKMVDDAIRKGAKWLLGRFDGKTHWVEGVAAKKAEDEGYAGGLQALAVYALMQAGLALPPGDDLHKELDLKGPGMTAKIDAMCKFDLDKGRHATYAYGLRATALALYVTNLPDLGNAKERSPLQEKRDAAKALLMKDAAWCVMATNDGSYGYVKSKGSPKTIQELEAVYNKIRKENKLPETKDPYDNSNAQYGLLGAWSAAEADIEIPSLYWYIVANHWMKDQLPNGQWPYKDGNDRGGTVNMTAAGLASMLVTHEYIEPALMSGSVGREPYNAPIKKGLTWFETGNNGVSAGGGYGTYGVERVGLASGFKFFGQHDWYRVMSQRIIKAQQADGSWKAGGHGAVVEASYYLLFLARGRHPILMNKLRFDGDAKTPGYWANRPRDAANLARTISKKIERPLNWQVINVATHWEEWLDSPIMSIASHQPYKFSEEELAKIRNYVESGGILYVQADGSSGAVMDRWAAALSNQLFKRELLNVPPNHPIYSNESVYKIQPPVPLKMVTNGSRIMMIYSNIDMARFWQARDNSPKARPYYEVAVNLFYYASGKLGFRNRLESLYLGEPKVAPLATYGVARLSYPSEWDPEPGAWRRFSNAFWRATGYKLTPAEVKINDLKPFDASKKADATNVRFAHLTGTVKQVFKPEAAAAVKAFVESGGVLFVDVTGGSNPFDESAQSLLKTAFPQAALKPVATTHPVIAGGAPGMQDLSQRRVLRPVVVERLGRQHGPLMMLEAGKGAVIFSPLDVTSGLLGTNTGGIYGYEAQYAQDLMQNAILWTLDGVKRDVAVAAEAAAQ